MKFSTALYAAALIATVSSIPIKRSVPENLVPQFGRAAGINPDGHGNCDGVNGIKVPCACPPDRASFIASLNANVAAGHAVNNPGTPVSFPTDNSKSAQQARIFAALVTLQNLHGPGVGCPASSTTFVAQQAAINAEPASGAQLAAPKPAAPKKAAPKAAPKKAAPKKAAPKAAPKPAAPKPAANNLAALVPSLGFTSGRNPTGTGDCDGAVQVNGKAIKVPCSCPPSQADFVQDVLKNVAAGKVVNNPSIPFSFPTDNSKASQAARIQAGLVTLQNLRGPGQGCPASSSTLSAQLKAVQ